MNQSTHIDLSPRVKNLPISTAAEVALQKAVYFLHPSHGVDLSAEEYHEAASVILEQACLAILNHKSTAFRHLMKPKKSKGRKSKASLMTYDAIADDCWPPAFDLRRESEDERFARLVLSNQ
jgi:hypothetical protein